jgi:WD40 repeat protein
LNHGRRKQATLAAQKPQKSQLRCKPVTPDSRQVILGGRQDGALVCRDLASGKEVHRLPVGSAPWVMVMHPDRRRLATAQGRLVTVRDAQTGAALGDPWLLPAEPWSLAWHGDEDLLAAGCGDNRIYLWDAGRRRELAVLEGHETGFAAKLGG